MKIKNTTTAIEYVVYELKFINDDVEALSRVHFINCYNSFKSEQEAIKAIVDNERTHEDFVILKIITVG